MSDVENQLISKEVGTRFAYHPADTKAKQHLHEDVRAWHLDLAGWIERTMPDCRERALALTALQESMMWCNAAVAYRQFEES